MALAATIELEGEDGELLGTLILMTAQRVAALETTLCGFLPGIREI